MQKKFDMTSLVRKSDKIDEEVSVYGIEDGSRYVNINDLASSEKNDVYISESYADKYNVKTGDTITLNAKYENKTYEFKVKGTYDKSQSISVFMPIDSFADIFGLKNEQFSGFLTDTKIDDIPERNIATTVTIRDITKWRISLIIQWGHIWNIFRCYVYCYLQCLYIF